MSVLIYRETRILVQGITGGQARVDTERALRYGVSVVAGVTPGRGGSKVHGVPVFDTVAQAMRDVKIDASIVYTSPLAVRDAVCEAVDGALALIVVTTEGVPLHDIACIVAEARHAGVRIVGCNTNGIISPGKSRIGGIGGVDPGEIYAPGSIGICSRSGGMSAELARTLKAAGWGVSTCVSMGGDRITGMSMTDIALLFEDDPETEALVIFGEPGTTNEQELAAAIAAGRVTKPVIALIAGMFQENYPTGQSFGHAAALVHQAADTASAKKQVLRAAGAIVADTLDEIPGLIAASAAERNGRVTSSRAGVPK
ncbi:MAG: succinate--CoA ligase subunit alpha [Casimicrobiaceae bacterium]